MKTIKMLLTAMVLMVTVSELAAQPPVAPGGPLAGPGAKPPKQGRHGGPGEQLQIVENFSGIVQDFITNPDFVYDGFTLKRGDTIFQVHFPPHLGSAVLAVAKKGASIQVAGVKDMGPDGMPSIRFVRIGSGNNVISNTPPVPETEPAEQGTEILNGKADKLVFNEAGDLSGIVISGSLLKLKPRARQLASMLQAGTPVSAVALKMPLRKGEVRSNNIKIYDCQTITINGVQYMM